MNKCYIVKKENGISRRDIRWEAYDRMSRYITSARTRYGVIKKSKEYGYEIVR